MFLSVYYLDNALFTFQRSPHPLSSACLIGHTRRITKLVAVQRGSATLVVQAGPRALQLSPIPKEERTP